MIFVTVGTHEQPFDRLLREVDHLAAEGRLGGDEVICQTGYSTYRPRVTSAQMLSFPEMEARISEASVVVSHGGPGTLIQVLAAGTPLVLVPRQRGHGEHVDDHQVAFCRRMGYEREIPVVEDIAELEGAIEAARGQRTDVASSSSPPPGVERLARLLGGLVEGGPTGGRIS